jgi:hypothetical protein
LQCNAQTTPWIAVDAIPRDHVNQSFKFQNLVTVYAISIYKVQGNRTRSITDNTIPQLHLLLSIPSMATVAAAGSKKGGGRGRRALVAVLDSDANISAGKADAVHSSAQKPKRAPSKSSKAKAAAPSPVADEMAELQGMLQRLRLEKEKAEEMVRERDDVIREKEEEIETRDKEQERLQAQLRKVQRAKEFNPTVVRTRICCIPICSVQISCILPSYFARTCLTSFDISCRASPS